MKATRRAGRSTQPDRSTSTTRAGTLFVVATPIGNLEDITLRALRILGEVQLVAAEDTRRTGNLLRHYEITTPLLSLHEHNEGQRIDQVVERLTSGESIALVTDAGTPGISDPGAVIVDAVRERGFRVEPIPGPSSVTAALSAVGLDASRFIFAGFPPIRLKDRKQWFEWVAAESSLPVVWFEAPHRIRQALQEAHIYFANRPIYLARELTKTHEEWLSGTAERLLASLSVERGEFVLVLGPAAPDSAVVDQPSDAEIADIFGQITNNEPGSRRDQLRVAAHRLKIPVKAVYEAIERHKNSIE